MSIIIGKLICAARKLLRVKRVHDYKRQRRFSAEDLATATFSDPAAYGYVRRCTRCGHTVAIKPRKPRKQEQQ